MSKKLLSAAALLVAGLAAIGCAGPDLQKRVDELTQQQDDLQRQKAQLENELEAYKTRCESLERSRSAPAPRANDMPADLSGKVDIRKRGNDTVIDIPSDVFFASGSATLSGASGKAMAQIADYIRKNYQGGMIRVEGHSDSDPIRRTKSKFHCNWELSYARAHAVMHYLLEKVGLDPRRMVCEAYGEYQPLDPKNKSKNRRVEIVLGN